MYVNSSGTENVSLSLTFLGKKVGRHCSVAPALKQRAWETTTLSQDPEDPAGPSRGRQAPVAVTVLEELPGSVPDLREEAQQHRPCPVHNTHIDHLDQDTAVVEHQTFWLRRWAAFRRWIGADRRRDQGQSESRLSVGSEGHKAGDRSADVKIYIPYESAEVCITQIAEDMQTMKTRHLEMVQELEENFQIAARDNQERTIQKIRSHYQIKLNTLRRILDLYQEKVEKKNANLEERVKALHGQNEILLEEQRDVRSRSKEEALNWQKEKSKMLELFSNRLDVLHSHQASTLQELQMARQEVGKVQEMLMSSSQVNNSQENVPEATENEGPMLPGDCSDQELPLEGAKARLEELKESLYQREREITELMEAERSPIPQPPCSVLLQAVIQKAHRICSEVVEARAQLDQLMEENHKALGQAREKLELLHMTADSHKGEAIDPEHERSDSSGEHVSHLALLEEAVRECEITQMALETIRSGGSPAHQECETAGDLEDIMDIHAAEGAKTIGQQLLLLQDQLKLMREQNKRTIEIYTSERTMRKKYLNMVEDMKGKIRVFCRIRPINRVEAAQGGAIIVDRVDDYTVSLETPRGPREFQFDKVFNPESSQEELFQDTNRLIQLAIDGYNICIFAYGQTGSGKTYTMVGDKEQKNPGIMPRAFNAIFDIIQENNTKFEFKVSAYMLELYNDRLQDLFVSGGEAQGSRRVEIKRNRKGLVFAQGAETKEASSAQELFALFQQAVANRHISATSTLKMNMESSRSHLIVGIVVESRNLTNGSVSFGKLSLVDLAGSERAAKTGAKDHQLKEANSINKSLSALGDVISALSSELPHVPYRNSKLTQIMQDSLGGNAKTLMIVNVSPSECNLDETLTSLIYATRVKAITNNAQRNVESKEIAQLKEVILKLRSGQTVEEEEV